MQNELHFPKTIKIGPVPNNKCPKPKLGGCARGRNKCITAGNYTVGIGGVKIPVKFGNLSVKNSMCRHILNAQVYIQGKCCDKFYGCAECHDEEESHPFQFAKTLRFMCKVCKKCFDRDFQLFSEKDKTCNYCGVCWCLPGVTPESKAYFVSRDILSNFLTEILDPAHPAFLPT